MAAYPTSIGLQHDIRPLNQRKIDISASGTVRSVNLNAATVFTIDLVHPVIDAADVATLTAFYDANRNSTNTITVAGDTYEAQFSTDYAIESISATYFNARVSLTGNRQ